MECKECSKELENSDSDFCPNCLQKKSDFELCIDLFSDNKPREIQKKIPSSPKKSVKSCTNQWKCSNCDIMVTERKCSKCNKIFPLLLPKKKKKKKKKKKEKKKKISI
jgi:hypothetical protein